MKKNEIEYDCLPRIRWWNGINYLSKDFLFISFGGHFSLDFLKCLFFWIVGHHNLDNSNMSTGDSSIFVAVFSIRIVRKQLGGRVDHTSLWLDQFQRGFCFFVMMTFRLAKLTGAKDSLLLLLSFLKKWCHKIVNKPTRAFSQSDQKYFEFISTSININYILFWYTTQKASRLKHRHKNIVKINNRIEDKWKTFQFVPLNSNWFDFYLPYSKDATVMINAFHQPR